MTAKAYDQAVTQDRLHYKLLWDSLVKIIEENYSIKKQGTNELFIRIPKQEMADVEVFLRGDGFHVQLWYYDLPDDMPLKHTSDVVRSASEVVERINELQEAVRITERRNYNER